MYINFHSLISIYNTLQTFIRVRCHKNLDIMTTYILLLDKRSQKCISFDGGGGIDILYTLDSASNYSAIQKLKP